MDNSVPPRPSPGAKRCSTYFVMCNGRCYNRSVLPEIAVLNWESLSCRLPGARPNSSERNYTHRAWIVTLALFAVLLSTPLFVSDRAAEATTKGLSKLCTRSPRGKWPGPVFAGLPISTTVP